MRIAITYEDGEIFQNFGPTKFFKIYDVEDGKITASRVVDTADVGHAGLAGLLQNEGVDTLICGGVGPGAYKTLTEAGFAIYPAVEGNADAAAQALLDGTLNYDKNYVPVKK